MANPDIFSPFEKLVEVEILGEKFSVPEQNDLLRCFQYLELEKISEADLCWNGDCRNCLVTVATEKGGRRLIACRTKVEQGMKIIGLSNELKTALRQAFGS